MNWISAKDYSPIEEKEYLCYWYQDDFNNGYVILLYSLERWSYPGLHNHNGVNYITHYCNLNPPK